mmetsp:Transcript_68522/g.190549  ORF Transcript_68522/g.190549 Transcript_68522/m.190549 type:complete len:314 (+) Transcript_68522:1429-2370(+)
MPLQVGLFGVDLLTRPVNARSSLHHPRDLAVLPFAERLIREGVVVMYVALVIVADGRPEVVGRSSFRRGRTREWASGEVIQHPLRACVQVALAQVDECERALVGLVVLGLQESNLVAVVEKAALALILQFDVVDKRAVRTQVLHIHVELLPVSGRWDGRSRRRRRCPPIEAGRCHGGLAKHAAVLATDPPIEIDNYAAQIDVPPQNVLIELAPLARLVILHQELGVAPSQIHQPAPHTLVVALCRLRAPSFRPLVVVAIYLRGLERLLAVCHLLGAGGRRGQRRELLPPRRVEICEHQGGGGTRLKTKPTKIN